MEITAEELKLFPYHKLGESKRESLGHPDSLGVEPPSDAHMDELKAGGLRGLEG